MRLVLMGTGPFAGPAFEALIDSPRHEVAAIVTRPQPAPSKGRRKPPPPNPMRELAQQRGLAILEPPSINSPEAVEAVGKLSPELLVVCDYGQILKPEALAVAPLGGINLHGSLLPKYRGAAPVHWAIWEGESTTGVTVIHMTPRLDGGPALTRAQTAIGPDETTEQLEPRLAQLGVEPVLQAIEMLERWDGESPIGEPQDPNQATKAPRLSREHGRIDWTQTAEQIYRQFRALQPWPGVFTTVPAKQPLRLILREIAIVDRADSAELTSSPEPGDVVRSDGQSLWVATADGAIDIQRVQPAGKREMEIAEFLRGHPQPPGATLHQPDA